jgi:hypothetical protein
VQLVQNCVSQAYNTYSEILIIIIMIQQLVGFCAAGVIIVSACVLQCSCLWLLQLHIAYM